MTHWYIMSDLHLEFHADHGDSFFSSIGDVSDSGLVSAGDLCDSRFLAEDYARLANKFKHVVFVLGNHEYYHSCPTDVHDCIARLVKSHSNLYWLHDSSVTIEGQRFVGCTLWFEEHPMNAHYEKDLNDFLVIYNFRPWVYKTHKRSVEYLKRTVKQSDIVVTHHIPTDLGIDPLYKDSTLNRFFVSDQTNFINDRQPRYWIYGHTHRQNNFKIGKTAMICNPLGYVFREDTSKFNDQLTIEIS